jgi:hypothetical protein
VRAPNRAATIGSVVPDSSREPPLDIASASHFVLTLDQDLGEGIRLGVEGFYKDFNGVPHALDDSEQAQASGVDLWLRRGTGRLTGWLGYSLAWIWSDDDQQFGTQLFAGRHLVSAGLAAPLGGQGVVDLRVAYGAGLPYTAIPEPETPVFATGNRGLPPSLDGPIDELAVPGRPSESYLRVDLQVARTFVTDVRGFAFELTPYFKLLNALDRRDALFYHFDRSEENPETRPLAPLPVLPILGLTWKF